MMKYTLAMRMKAELLQLLDNGDIFNLKSFRYILLQNILITKENSIFRMDD